MALERLGPYRIERRIGRGGMGTVFSAVTDVTGERTAVKVLSAAHDGREEGFHDRFAAEIESLRILHHPNIVRILGYGDEEDCRYYVMELVDGQSMQDALDAGRRYTWQDAVRYGIQICRALKHAHDHGIIHRDIKPANLLLAPDGIVKLSDFGIAKQFGNSGMTADGGVIGTAEYMAPEQADGRPVTNRSDLYSFGGVLFSLLTGRGPFRAKNLMEMLQLQRFAEPDPVSRLNPSVPRALSDLVAQLLLKDPAKRPPTALVVARQLEAILAKEPATLRANPGAGLEVRPAVSDPALPGSPPNAGAEIDASSPTHDGPIGGSPANGAARDLIFSLSGDTALPSARVASDVVPASASSLGKPVGGEFAVGATTDFGALDPALKELEAVRSARAESSMERTGTISTRTYTPVAKDEHRKLSDDDDDARVWISPATFGLVFAMLSIGLFAWYWLQPPKSEPLYEQIKAASKEGKIERLVDVEGKIKDFMNYYPGDRRVSEMQAYLDEIEMARLERRFEYRAKFLSKNDGLLPIERAYFEAIGYVHLEPALGRKKMQALIDLFREESSGSKPARECYQLAQKQLDRLDQQFQQHASDDVAVIERKLKEADRLEATDAEAAKKMRKAIVELYADEPWAEAQVRSIRAMLAEPAGALK
ncbi:MAG: serine/threonine protein kinase [Planctomycetia bacterium]|nr:serine/threonine protein kinase [Planctomycetia bacterium]